MQNCCKVTLGREYFSGLCFPLVSSYFSYKHNCNFVRADACDISSIQSSRHHKMGLRGNNLCGLGFIWDDINCHYVAYFFRQKLVASSVFMAFILNRCHYFFVVFLFFCSEICQVNNYKRRALYLLIVKSRTLWLLIVKDVIYD